METKVLMWLQDFWKIVTPAFKLFYKMPFLRHCNIELIKCRPHFLTCIWRIYYPNNPIRSNKH